MENKGLKIAKDILMNTFLIGYAFIIVFSLIYFEVKSYWMNLIVGFWHINDTNFIDRLVVSFFGLAKFVLIFYVLVPALAINWTLKKLKKNML